MRLTKLAEGIGQIVYQGDEKEVDIAALYTDSRLVEENGLFFCLTGGNVDGHTFATQAVKKGANALVVEKELPLNVPQIVVENTRIALAKMAARFYGNPEERLKIIGITGTNGKTTTSYMLQSILEKAGKKTGVYCYGRTSGLRSGGRKKIRKWKFTYGIYGKSGNRENNSCENYR